MDCPKCRVEMRESDRQPRYFCPQCQRRFIHVSFLMRLVKVVAGTSVFAFVRLICFAVAISIFAVLGVAFQNPIVLGVGIVLIIVVALWEAETKKQ